MSQLAAQEFVDAEVQEAEYLLQPPAARPETRPTTPSRAVRRASFREYASLDRVPNMYGDFLGVPFQINFDDDTNRPFQSDLPFGVGRSYKVGENNKPLPMDRIYFNYNGFQNALFTQRGSPGIPNGFFQGDANVDRYTLGLEKTFFDGNASLDVRMPFVGSFNSTDNINYAITSGNVGDLSMFYKQLLYMDDMVAIAAGTGVGLPTGDDVNLQVFGSPLTLNNDAVHVMPYVGALIVPNEYWFFQTFLELDFAASGNELSAGRQNVELGQLTEQHLLEVDFSGGYWLLNNLDAYYLQGIAAILELHYTTTIQDGDVLFLGRSTFGGLIGNQYNRVDFLNLTGGLHVQIGPLTNLRVGCAVPLHTSGENRQFDSEVQVQLNRFF
jgi:hypothetical protein